MTEKNSKETNLELLQKEYALLQKKYKLPEFTGLNEIFDIEEADIETEFLMRKIRRVIIDKITGYLRFVETILNPANAPIFFLKLIKKLDPQDREVLGKMYEHLGNLETEVICLDLDYSEEKEAQFIKKVYTLFRDSIQKDLLLINYKLIKDVAVEKRTNGSYFG
ncbi:hypothetical protein J4456_01260 [Candidatus Pacearchaeota archaeon]|nr:hypothetical protein [Candidatus Pacearchaeota archaeon]